MQKQSNVKMHSDFDLSNKKVVNNPEIYDQNYQTQSYI